MWLIIPKQTQKKKPLNLLLYAKKYPAYQVADVRDFVYALITYDFEYVLISLYFLIINIDIALIWIPFIDKKHIKTNQKNTKMAVKEIINSSVLIDFLPNKKYKSANFIHFRNSAKYL